VADNIFAPPLVIGSEIIRSRLGPDEILARSAHPNHCFIRSRRDSGWTSYHGQITAIECEFHISLEEYEARDQTPLPAEHPTCITVGLTSERSHGSIGAASAGSAPHPKSESQPAAPLPNSEVDLETLLNRAGKELRPRKKRTRRDDV
jgi:hypothetical protein